MWDRRGFAGIGSKANGAGIAADPTLTSAWSSRKVPPEGSVRIGKRLAPDVSPVCRQAGFQVPSPALAPASGSALVSHPVRRPAPRRLGATETDQSVVAVQFAVSRIAPKRTASSGMDNRNVRPDSSLFRYPLERCPCFWSKPSAGVPRGPREQIRYLFRAWKIALVSGC